MGVIRLARIGLAVAAGLVVSGALSAPAVAAGDTVQGTFTNAAQAPIQDAQVTAYDTDGNWLYSGYTDRNGRYRLGDLGGQQFTLQFNDQGRTQYAPGAKTRAAGTVYSIPAAGTLTVDERQAALGRVTGRFTDDEGAPQWVSAGAEGVDSESSVYAQTDEEGTWSLDTLPGTYKIKFEWGSVRQWAFHTGDKAAATVITVAAGQTAVVDDHKLPTGSISGHLTRPDGSALPEAQLTLHRGDDVIGFGYTDENGWYSFGEALAADDYTVSYSVDNDTTFWVPGTISKSKARKFAVTTGQETVIDERQPARGTVRGKLAEPDGEPKAGYFVNVTLADDDVWAYFEATTAADGTWSVDDVYPGDYRVSFQTPDYGRMQWAYGKDTAEEATLIPVAGPSTVVDETWIPGATVLVDAVDATTGAPVTGFCASVSGTVSGDACAGNGSRATVTDLPAGRFDVQVTPDENSYYVRSDATQVTLTVGQTVTVTIRLALGGKIALSAADHATGKPLEGVCGILKVLGTGGLGDGGGDCTDPAGTATTQTRAAGTYEVFAVAPDGYGHQWVGTTGGTGDQRAAARIVVRPGKTVAAPTALVDKAGTITGVVSGPSGAPLSGYDVAFSAWGDAGPVWDDTTDVNGRYTIGRLGPYSWPLLFGGSDYAREWSGHVGNRFEAAPVAVVAGQSVTYDFTPRTPVASLAGKVRPASAPAANWRINIVNAVTGDQMAVFDGTSAGPGGTYAVPLAGSQKVKIAWHVYDEANQVDGWYDHAADIATATKVSIPARGAKKLNLTLG